MHAVRVLFVEDDPEQREMMVRFVRLRGYEAECAGSVAAALRKLDRNGFDMLVLDWSLPDGTAAEVIAAASTPWDRVLVVSAELRPPVPRGVETLRKPLEAQRLAAALRVRARRAVGRPGPGRNGGDGEADAIDLALYVRPGPDSEDARRHLQEALERHPSIPVRVEVREIAEDEGAPLPSGRALIAPTLLRRAPLPKAWICGDLSDPDLLDDLVLTGAAGAASRAI
jgi:CheY-like chemotaxis protein